MKAGDCDEQVLNYLKVLPMEVVKQSITDFCELDKNEGLDNVTNRSSFFLIRVIRSTVGHQATAQ